MAYYLLYFLAISVVVCGTGTLHSSKPKSSYRSGYHADKFKVLYLTRARWLSLVPVPDYIYDRLPSSFADDLEAGLTSTQFDLSANIADGDTRAGLDNQAKRQIRKIMNRQRIDFDEARRIYTEQRFANNNIGPDGRPRDPKFVSFS